MLGAVVALAEPFDWLRGLSLDTSFWLREQLYSSNSPAETDVVIVALDEETYLRPPFRGTPKAIWTPEIGAVLTAVLDGGASVVGMDLILPTSIQQVLPGHDRPLLLALREGAKDSRVVLARVQHQTQPIAPHRGLAIAAGRDQNIRLANVVTDLDGVVRRTPLWFKIGGTEADHQPSFSLEIAARALGEVR